MTPEERAAKVVEGLYRGRINRLYDDAAIVQFVTAAIREAVDAETEACAAVADDHDESATFPTAGVDTGRIWRSASARRIAEQIRQRAASRAQPAPKETP